MELEFGAFTIKGKKERGNEDHYRLLTDDIPLIHDADRGQMFGVFDGMGSTPRAAEASWHVGQSITDFFKLLPIPNPNQISDLLYQANQEIFNWGFVENTTRRQGGCVGTVAWFSDDLHIFHAGDTLALLLRSDSKNDSDHVRLTTDHSSGHVLHRYFGKGKEFVLEENRVEVKEGDVLVLVTDGVTTSNLSIDEIATKVRDWVYKSSANNAAQKICTLARDRGSRDDITAVIVEILDVW